LFLYLIPAIKRKLIGACDLAEMKKIDETPFLGRELGTVVLERELGRGNMGIVFVGLQKTLKRQVAVKVLPKSQVSSDMARQQFRDEAETVAVLNHPNIVPIFEMGEVDDCYFQVMQLVNGKDLRTIIKDRYRNPVNGRRALPLAQCIDLATQMLDGLGYAHAEGVVHQDIKPANILVETRSMRPLIADFGIAKTAQIEYSTQGFVVGTPLYLSPEQAAGRTTDNRSDIYSAGVVFFESITGALPLRNEGVDQFLNRKIQSPETIFAKKPSEASPEITPELEDIIMTALAPDPQHRFQDCRAFRERLLHFKTSRASRPAEWVRPQ
jgi:eukaryotic-like serine/threonine-protein kinase